MKKKWLSPVNLCDYCSTKLVDQPYFVDGRTNTGPWALMCPKCFDVYGTGLGLGKGQKYDSKTKEQIA